MQTMMGHAPDEPPCAPCPVRDGRAWLCAVLLVGAVVVAFWPVLNSSVIDADLGFPPAETGPGFAPAQLGQVLADVRGARYSPLTWATLRVDSALWGLRPRGSHAVNLGLHAASAVLVYLLALGLLAAAHRSPLSRHTAAQHAGALGAALLFALHPLRVEPVAWVMQRGVLLSAFLMLLTTLLYTRACASGKRRWLAAAIIGQACAVAAGPWGLALPLILLLLDVYPLRRGTAPAHAPPTATRAQTAGLRWRIVLEKIVFAGVAGAGFALCFWLDRSTVPHEPGALNRAALAAYGLVFYLWKTVCPWGLLPLYEFRTLRALLTPQFLAAVAGTLVLVVVVLRFGRRLPALTVAALSYVLLLLPAVALIQSDVEAAGDRYGYLPSVPVMLALGGGLAYLWNRRPPRAALLRAAVATLALTVAVVLGVLTWRQCGVWRTPLTLWAFTEQHDPNSGLASYRLARQYENSGEYERAVQFYRAAARLRPGMFAVQLGLGNALLQELNFKEAIAALRRAVSIAPRSGEARFLLGAALAAAGESDEAEQVLRQAAELDPQAVWPRRSLGHLLMICDRPAEAAEAFQAALAIAPHDADVHYNLGRAYWRAGRWEDAAAAFRQALREDPAHRLAAQALEQLATQPATAPAAPE